MRVIFIYKKAVFNVRQCWINIVSSLLRIWFQIQSYYYFTSTNNKIKLFLTSIDLNFVVLYIATWIFSVFLEFSIAIALLIIKKFSCAARKIDKVKKEEGKQRDLAKVMFFPDKADVRKREKSKKIEFPML